MNIINNRLAALRLNMKAENIAAFIVPSSDPHQSEYLASHWQFRQWITGFTGSAGVFFITETHAGLSTDSRYFIQAEEELSTNEVVLHKQKIAHAPQVIPWLIEHLNTGDTIGIDPQLFSIAQINNYKKQLADTGLSLQFSSDLIKKTWVDRPSLPNDKIFDFDVSYAGSSRLEKINKIRAKMQEDRIDYHLITTLDDIAWIFNIRGSDIESNPVAMAYAVIGKDTALLFAEEEKFESSLLHQLHAEGISVRPYLSISSYLEVLGEQERVLLAPGKTNAYLYDSIKSAQIIRGDTISTAMKAIKHPVEVEHIKAAMLKDGVALTRLFRWLETTLQDRSVKETEVATQLAQFRKEQGDYHGESFSAIVGYQGNGAIVHYRAQEATCADILPEGILLLDSGGQYLNGTTDITRTIALSPPTDIQKRDYTLVLKGHISLATLRFPHGTRGNQMEVLARRPLWQYGLNYGHGTGHGVGFFLNVHEGPQALSPANKGKAAEVFEAGMFTSNEPGFYKTGEYGIRIENLVLCVEDQETEFGKFLKFETLSLFPIDTTLIDFSLLTKEEVQWLNDYHAEVFEKLSPLLSQAESRWLQEKCKAV